MMKIVKKKLKRRIKTDILKNKLLILKLNVFLY